MKRKKLQDLYSRRWGWAGFFTHIHHAQANPIELSDDIRERFAFIKRNKRPREKALRKALIIRVPDSKLPEAALEYLKAVKEWEKAESRENKFFNSWCDSADGSAAEAHYKKAYDRAVKITRKAYLKIERLERKSNRINRQIWVKVHEQVCHPNCRWTPGRQNIFADGYSTSVLRRKKKKK